MSAIVRRSFSEGGRWRKGIASDFAKASSDRGSSPDEVVKGTLHRAGQGQQFSEQISILQDAPMGIGAPQELGLFRVIRGSKVDKRSFPFRLRRNKAIRIIRLLRRKKDNVGADASVGPDKGGH